jgi:hypothetical protein
MALALGLVASAAGCAWAPTPAGTGSIFTQVKYPVEATGANTASKTGKAQATNILGWVVTGDASIEAAAKAGGITKIHSIDADVFSVLGIFATYTVTVKGE